MLTIGTLICSGDSTSQATSVPEAVGRYLRKDGASSAPSAISLSGTGSEALTIEVKLQKHALGEVGKLVALNDVDGKTVVTLEVRLAGKDPSMKWWDDLQQNYPRWGGPDGSVLVLEAIFDVDIKPPYLAKVKHQIRVGVPVSKLGASPKSILLRIKPGISELAVDGQVVDVDSPCGGLGRPVTSLLPGSQVTEASVWRSYFTDATAGIEPVVGVETGVLNTRELQYWSPPGHNQWVGDAMLFHDGERLHLLYLIDRRHGACKFSAFAHMSTADLKRWTVHPFAAPVTEPWDVRGTGMMFKHGSKWKIIYGMHTDRVVEAPSVVTLLDGKGIPFSELKGFPMGAAIATSDDGIHFHKENILVHLAQNPSVFPDPRGGFAMFAGYGADGLHRSDDLINWSPSDHCIVPFGASAPSRNSTECYCHFEWNGWHYIMGGRTGFWMAQSFAGPYWDQQSEDGLAVAKGMRSYFDWKLKGAPPTAPHIDGKVTVPRWDIYDGLWVPMASEAFAGRKILAGWLEDYHPGGSWGGNLVFRELHQEPDGNLSMKWLPEAIPTTGPALKMSWSGLGENATLNADQAPVSIAAGNAPDEYVFEVEVDPKDAMSAYSLILGSSGEMKDGCELRIEPQRKRAQWGQPANGQLAPETPDAADLANTPDGKLPVYLQKNGNAVFHGADFTITGIEGTDHPHRIRMAFIQDRKSGSVIIDAEIAGRRTMITRRHNLSGRDIQLVAVKGGVSFSKMTVLPIKRDAEKQP